MAPERPRRCARSRACSARNRGGSNSATRTSRAFRRTALSPADSAMCPRAGWSSPTSPSGRTWPWAPICSATPGMSRAPGNLSSRSFRASPSGSGRPPARSPAASNRCWRSAGRSWGAPAFSCSTNPRSASPPSSSAASSRRSSRSTASTASQSSWSSRTPISRCRSRTTPTSSRTGRIAIDGTPQELRTHPQLRAAYLGD